MHGSRPDHVDATRIGTGWIVGSVPDPWQEFPLLFKADLEPLGEDGTGWAIEDYQVAADGSILIIVRDDRREEDRVTGDGLYVITPGAVGVVTDRAGG